MHPASLTFQRKPILPQCLFTPLAMSRFGHLPTPFLLVSGKLKEELDSLLSAGIIEPSQSEWSSPPILVKKKD